jgi:hypothetical protein
MTALGPPLAPWVGALFTVFTCYALGSLFLARLRVSLLRAEKPPLAFVTGAALLHLVIFAILTLHVAYVPVLIAVLGAIVAAALYTGDLRLPSNTPSAPPRATLIDAVRVIFFLIAGTFTFVYIFCAWAPEISPDGSSYHLPFIATYLRAHGFVPVPSSFYSTLSEGVEMIFLPAFGIAGLFFSDPSSVASLAAQGSAAALVHFAFLCALALLIRAYGQRTGHALAGEAAALLVFLSPVAGVVGTSAYVDLGTTAAVFATFYWIQLWDENRSNASLICIGLLGGYCYATKYTAAIMAIYGAGFVLWRTRSWRPVAIVAACAAIMALPWMSKDWIYVHNPVAPFANLLFRNPYIHPEFERVWTEYLRTYGSTDLWKLPWDILVTGNTTGNLLGPVFLILPLALLSLRNTAGRRVLLPAALLCSTYFANIGARFLLPALPFLSFALVLVFEDVPLLLLAFAVFHAVASWPRTLKRYAGKDTWIIARVPTRAAMRNEREDTYLRRSLEYEPARLIESVVPPGEKVLTANGFAKLYTTREIIVGFEGALNEQLEDILDCAWDKIAGPSRAIVFRFAEHSVRRLRVVQTAVMPRPDEQWSIHELRFFLGGKEIPRANDWRLRAFPNPRGVGYAFDNSPVTRWRTWETAKPGNYVEIEFPSPIRVDRLQIETSADNPDIRLQLEEMDASGRWTPLSSKPQDLTRAPENSLRRAAAYELQAQGVRYLLVRDGEPSAASYADDPASWNFSIAARSPGAIIYKVGRE